MVLVLGSEVLGCCTLLVESQSSAGLGMKPYPRAPGHVLPGHLHGTGCLSGRAMDTGFPTAVWRAHLVSGFPLPWLLWVWVSGSVRVQVSVSACPLPVPARARGVCGWIWAAAGSMCVCLGAGCGVGGGYESRGVAPSPPLFWMGVVVVLGCGLGCYPPPPWSVCGWCVWVGVSFVPHRS